MDRDPDYFRERATLVRKLAKTARDDVALRMLLLMADEFDEEVRLLESKASPPQSSSE